MMKDDSKYIVVPSLLDVELEQLDEYQLKRIQISLRERVKELDCIFYVFKLIQNSETTLSEVAEGVIGVIPASWLHPEITAARMEIGDQEWKTANFKKTDWCQTEDIIVEKQKVGTLEVVYLEQRPLEDEGPFLKEERLLIKQIADTISMYLKQQNDQKKLVAKDEQLEKEKNNLQLIIDSSPNLIFIKDWESRFLLANNALANLYGTTNEQMINKTEHDFISDPKVVESFVESDREVMITGKQKLILEDTIVDSKGNRKWYQTVKIPLAYNKNKEKRQVLGISTDITERKIIQGKLEEKERLYRGLVESQHDLIVRFDMDHRFTFVNDVFCKTFGRTSEELLGNSFTHYIQEEDREDTIESMKDLEKPPYKAYKELKEVTVHGDRWISWEAYAIKNSEGETVEVQAVGRDITALKEAQQKAEDANKAKSQFLANMSHEIRTPMNAVIGMTELLEEHVVDEEYKEYVQIMKKNGESLLHLINDILDLSKIEAGKMDMHYIGTNICDLVKELGASYKPMAAKKGLALIASTEVSDPTRCMAITDENRIRQVLVNLIGNAIKFTDVGEIRIIFTITDDKMMRFTIQDTGIGISKEKQKDIFNAFNQADSSTTRSYSGTGLGLTISQRIAEQMGGLIWVEGEAGEGSIFILEVPYHPAIGTKGVNL